MNFKMPFQEISHSEISSFNTNYYIPNVRRSYISAKLNLGIDGYGNFSRSFVVDRPFYSPLAKWAAGVSFASEKKKIP